MENQYKRLFDSIAPIKSDEELLKAVLDRKAEKMNPKKKFSKKAILIPAAAAALLGTTAIGVSAAYQWNLPAAFEDLFRNRYEAYNGIEEAGPRRNAFDFSVIGKELFLYYNFDKFDVVIRGIAADEHSVFLLYDVDFAEDFDYALADGEEWFLNLRPVMDLSWVKSYDGNMDPSVDWQNRLINMEGGRAHCCSTINVSGISLQDRALVYSFDGLVRSSGDNKDTVGVEEKKFSVDMDFWFSKNSVKLRPNEAVTLAGGETGKVDYIGLSTFGLELHAEWDDPSLGGENMCEKLKSAVTVNYKDGTTSDSSAFTAGYVGSSGSTWNSKEDGYSSSVLLSWLYPVYMEDIKSVTIGDKTFRLDSAFSAPAFDFASIGKEIDRSYEFDDYTLNVRGLITDGYSVYIVCYVIFDEDFDYAPKDGWDDWDLGINADLPRGNGVPSVVNGNVYTFYHRVGTNDNTTLRGKTVTFDFEQLSRWKMPSGSEKDETPDVLESETLDCGVTLKVDFDFDVTRGNKTVTGSTPVYLSELFGSGTLTYFTVTPFGIQATIADSDITDAGSLKAEDNDFDLSLRHSDGSVTLLEGGGRLVDGTLYIGGVEYPINTSDIVSAKIGSVEVDLHSGKFSAAPTENAVPDYYFKSLGTAIGESWEGKGYNITINGVVADPNVANFIYTVEFNDEFPYDYAHMDVYGVGWFDWQVSKISATVNGEDANIGVEMHNTDQVWLDDNTLRGSFTIFCDDTSFENSEITVSVGELRHQHTSAGGIDHERRVDCGLTAGFTLGDMSGMERSVALNETVTSNDGITKAVLTEINITPFKFDYTLKSTDGTEINYVNFVRPDEYVTLKDGTRISVTSGGASFSGGLLERTSRLSYPVNPADVESVSVCGREVNLR